MSVLLEQIEKILSDSQAEKHLCVDHAQARDPLREVSYFQLYIQEDQQRIRNFVASIRSGEPTRIFVERKMFELSIQCLVANYSMGKDIGLLKAELLETIVYCQYGAERNKYHFDEYMWMLWMLSLGILLEIENEQYQKIVDVLRESGVEDVLFEFLIQHKLGTGRDVKDMFFGGNYFEGLASAIDPECSPEEAIEYIKGFLRIWYRNMRHTIWYGTHKMDSINLYFGYWSFEAAALVKILGLGKNTLAKQKYFPQDIV